jgi:ribosome-interacting GTPase 1
VERERASGLDQRVVFVGRGRDFLGLSEVVREMVAGTLDEDKHPYFTKSPVSGVWQHDGNKTKVTISIPAFERETRE